MRLKYSPFDKSPERGISLQEADDQQPSSSVEVIEGHQEHTSSSSNPAQNSLANEAAQGQALLVLNLPQDEDSSMSNLTVSTNGIVSSGDTSLHASQISCSGSTLFSKENEDASNKNDDDISVASDAFDEDLVIISPSRTSSKARSTGPRDMMDHDSISTSKSYQSEKDFSPSTLQAIGQSLIVEDEDSTVCSKKVKASTEEKWSEEQLQAAKEILPFLESSHKPKKRYPLPPLPSSEEYDFDLVISQEEKALSEKFLSEEFICHLCNGPIVGAAMYSCSCNKCACIMCIEKESNSQATLDVNDHKCGTCLTCTSVIPCGAMDKAILTVIEVMDTLSSQHDNVDIEIVKSFQARYYARLREWYKEAAKRNNEMDHEEELEKMRLLNEYAQYESDHFKRMEEEESKTLKDTLMDSTFLVGAMVAPIIVFGVRAILRK